MRAESGEYNPKVVRALIRIAEGQIFYDHRVVSLGGLSAGMILAENIQPASGVCLLGKGQEITCTLLERLWHFSKRSGPMKCGFAFESLLRATAPPTAHQPQPAPPALPERPVP